MQIRQHIRLKCFSSSITIYNNLSVKNLNVIIAIVVSVEMRSGIYEDIQLNTIYERCIVELFVAIRNNQRVKITVQIVCSVGIRAIKDDGNRVVFLLYVLNNPFQ